MTVRGEVATEVGLLPELELVRRGSDEEENNDDDDDEDKEEDLPLSERWPKGVSERLRALERVACEKRKQFFSGPTTNKMALEKTSRF